MLDATVGTRASLSRGTSEVGREAIFCDDHGREILGGVVAVANTATLASARLP